MPVSMRTTVLAGTVAVVIAIASVGGIVLVGYRTEPGAQLLRQVLREYNSDLNKLKKEMLKTKTRDYVAQNFISEAPLERLSHYGPRFLHIADEFPSTDVAWKALRQVALVGGFTEADKETAMRTLVEEHSSRQEFSDELFDHHFRPGIDANRFYRIILEQTSLNSQIAGLTKYSLAVGLSGVLTNEDPITDERLVEAVGLLRSVQQDHSSAASPIADDARTLGQAAADLEFQLTNLRVGRKAPDIVGEDVEGNTIRLSDYHGDAVLLVFGGEWCGPCKMMYPFERQLVQDFEGQPFSILAINSDSKRVLRNAIKRERFPWKCIWDGGSPFGPITARWGPQIVPAYAVVDRSGIIRKKYFERNSIEELAGEIRRVIEKVLNQENE